MNRRLPSSFATEGARLLASRPESHAEVAARIGVSRQAVAAWRSGSKTPDVARRGALREAYGIAPELWERRPRQHASGPAERAGEGILAPPFSGTPLPASASELDALIDQLVTARRQPGIAADTLARLAGVEVRARAARADLASDMERLLASPDFDRMCNVLLAAVAPDPLTHVRVCRAIGLVEGDAAMVTKSDARLATWRERLPGQVHDVERACAQLRAAIEKLPTDAVPAAPTDEDIRLRWILGTLDDHDRAAIRERKLQPPPEPRDPSPLWKGYEVVTW